MRYSGDIFKFYKFCSGRAEKFGFRRAEGSWEYSVTLPCGFELSVTIADGEINTKITDCEAGEEYVLAYTDSTCGGFIGAVRSEYEAALEAIRDDCFERNVFKTLQAAEIVEYIRTSFGTDPEYLWDKFPNNAVFRDKQTGKWFAAILTARRATLALDGNGDAEVIDLKAPPEEIESILGKEFFLPGYHMNKKHWFTICLDCGIPTREIFRFIDKSYSLVK